MEKTIRKRRSSVLLPIILSVAAILLAVYVYFDPSDTWWMPKCPVHLLTGLECPGCGSQRAIHALLRGNFAEAWHHNALLLTMMPLLGLMAYSEATRQKNPRLYRKLFHPAVIAGIIAIIAIFTVIRNLL